jgi:uncharacterized protein
MRQFAIIGSEEAVAPAARPGLLAKKTQRPFPRLFAAHQFNPAVLGAPLVGIIGVTLVQPPPTSIPRSRVELPPTFLFREKDDIFLPYPWRNPMPLEKTEREAIELLNRRLREHFGPELSHLVLFGSKARGDDGPDSDVDVLIVLGGKVTEKQRLAVSDIVYEVLESCGVFIQTVVLSKTEFEHPTGQLRWLTSFVREEGIAL